MATSGCPVFSRNHIKKSVTGSGPLQITTKDGISPELRGVFRVHCLNPLTRAQMGDQEDQGADAAANQQRLDDGRIARRIPVLMNSVWNNPHPNVMEIHGFLRANTTDKNVQFLKEDSTTLMRDVTHVIYENCRYNLKEYIENESGVNQQTIFQWAFELISAIDHLHISVGVMHRRINPETVYIFEDDDGKTTLKLGDILFARKPSSLDVTAERNVPIAYAAPETFGTQNNQLANYGLPADIWSYGMVLYFITHRQDPYPEEITRKGFATLMNHIRDEERPALNVDLDDTLKEIITNCWNFKSTERFTAAQKIKEKLAPKINGQN